MEIYIRFSVLPNFSHHNQWNILVKKWKLQQSSYCHILVCFEGSHLQTYTWKRTTIPGNLFAMGCFHSALNWIHQSGLSKEWLTVWNVHKRDIDFNCWAHSVTHIIARDVASLIRPFTFNFFQFSCFQMISLMLFLFFFRTLLELCNPL